MINFSSDEQVSFNNIAIQDVFINDVDKISEDQNKLKSINRIFTYYYTNYDKDLKVDFIVNKKTKLKLKVTEVSYDLLSNSLFSIKPRSEHMMAKPFVTNDAIILIQNIDL